MAHKTNTAAVKNAPTSKPMKLGSQTGSLMNWMMSGSHQAPVVGQGATELMWSDRHAYEVLKVSEDYKDVVIRAYKPERIDDNGMSESQEYAYKELEGPEIELRWMWGAYRRKVYNTSWDKKNHCWKDNYVEHLYKEFGKEEAEKMLSKRNAYTWEKMNIIFGVKEEYYDFSF